MKYFIIVVICVILANFINWSAQSLVYRTVVGKWYFQAKEISEPKYYGGFYIQINDSLRIVKKKGVTREIMTLQLKVSNTSYRNTGVIWYSYMFNYDKWETLRAFQSEWEDSVRSNKIPKTFFKN